MGTARGVAAGTEDVLEEALAAADLPVWPGILFPVSWRPHVLHFHFKVAAVVPRKSLSA